MRARWTLSSPNLWPSGCVQEPACAPPSLKVSLIAESQRSAQFLREAPPQEVQDSAEPYLAEEFAAADGAEMGEPAEVQCSWLYSKLL